MYKAACALTALLLLWGGQAWAAIGYIDPTCTNNGDGTVGTGGSGSGASAVTVCAISGGGPGPFNTWASATTWSGNAQFYGKGGTTFTGACQFLINNSGADINNQIIVGSYGTGRHALNCTSGNYAFGFGFRSFIKITNLDFTTAVSNCLFVQSSTDIVISGNLFKSCAVFGIGFNNGITDNFDRITIDSNIFSSTGNSAISSSAIPATNINAWDDILITNNSFLPGVANNSNAPAIDFIVVPQTIVIGITNTSTAVTAPDTTLIIPGTTLQSTAAAGIPVETTVSSITDATHFVMSNAATVTNASFSASFSAAATIRGMKITGNTFAGVNYNDSTPSYIVRVGRSTLPTPLPTDQSQCTHDGSIVGFDFHGNSFSQVGGGPLYLNNATTSATYKTILIYSNVIDQARANVGIDIFYSLNPQVYSNVISNVTPLPASSYFDGAGIGFDYCNSGGSVYQNYIHDIPGSTVLNTELNGQGIEIFASGINGSLGGARIYSNIIANTKKGIYFGNPISGSATPAHNAYNNTIVNSTLDGIESSVVNNQTNGFTNNVVMGSGRYGINKGTVGAAGQFTMAKTELFGNATNYGVQTQTPDATAITSDPKLAGGLIPTSITGFKLGASSPLIGAGNFVGPYSDYRGCPFFNPPSIGGFERCGGDISTSTGTSTAGGVAP